MAGGTTHTTKDIAMVKRENDSRRVDTVMRFVDRVVGDAVEAVVEPPVAIPATRTSHRP